MPDLIHSAGDPGSPALFWGGDRAVSGSGRDGMLGGLGGVEGGEAAGVMLKE